VSDLRAQGVLDAEHQLHDAGELARRDRPAGGTDLAVAGDRVLPALAPDPCR